MTLLLNVRYVLFFSDSNHPDNAGMKKGVLDIENHLPFLTMIGGGL